MPDNRRIILHVDMDAFFASVEQLDNPLLKGKPVIVGALPDSRGVVAAASYEARKYGIRSAMPSRVAARMCPGAIFIRPRLQRYKEISEKVFAVLEEFTPFIEQMSIDEAFLDISTSCRILGSPRDIAEKIKKQIYTQTGLTASIGIGPNKFLAKLGSEMGKPDGLFEAPFEKEAIKNFLAPLDIGKLYGAGKKTVSLLIKHGFSKIGDLQKVPLDFLASIIGKKSAAELIAFAFGNDERPVNPSEEIKSISREYTFDKDCSTEDAIRKTLLELVLEVGSQLRKSQKYVRSVQIKIRWDNFTTITRQKTLSVPVCDDFSLREVALELWEDLVVNRPVRLIGFEVHNMLSNDFAQLELSEKLFVSRQKLEKLSKTADKLEEKFGKKIIKSASLIKTSF